MFFLLYDSSLASYYITLGHSRIIAVRINIVHCPFIPRLIVHSTSNKLIYVMAYSLAAIFQVTFRDS